MRIDARELLFILAGRKSITDPQAPKINPPCGRCGPCGECGSKAGRHVFGDPCGSAARCAERLRLSDDYRDHNPPTVVRPLRGRTTEGKKNPAARKGAAFPHIRRRSLSAHQAAQPQRTDCRRR